MLARQALLRLEPPLQSSLWYFYIQGYEAAAFVPSDIVFKKQSRQPFLISFLFFFVVLGLELRASTLSHSISLFFVMDFFPHRVF
jgi:hypothetical protein